MYDASPISHVQDRFAPALLMLGAKDRRVPPSQGVRWAEYLRSRNHSIKVLMFPKDGHPLDSFEAQKRGFEACTDFFILFK